MSWGGVVPHHYLPKAESLSQEIWNYFASCKVEMEQLFRVLPVLFPSQGLFNADTDIGVTVNPLGLQFVGTASTSPEFCTMVIKDRVLGSRGGEMGRAFLLSQRSRRLQGFPVASSFPHFQSMWNRSFTGSPPTHLSLQHLLVVTPY